VNVVDTLHGVAVPDPYRWMENMDAPDVVAWARAGRLRRHCRRGGIRRHPVGKNLRERH